MNWPQSHSHRARPGPRTAYELAQGPCRLGSWLSFTSNWPCFLPKPRLQTPNHCAGLARPGPEEKRLRGRSWGLTHLSPVSGHPV